MEGGGGSAGEDCPRPRPAQAVAFCSPAEADPSSQSGTSLFLSFFIWERTSLGRERAVSHCQHPLAITPSPPPHDPHPPTPIHTESGAELEKGRQECSRLLGLRASAPRPAASPRDPDGRTHSPEDITCPPRGPADTGNSPQLPGIKHSSGMQSRPHLGRALQTLVVPNPRVTEPDLVPQSVPKKTDYKSKPEPMQR